MDQNDLAELEIEEDGFKLRLRKREDGQLVRNYEQMSDSAQHNAGKADPEFDPNKNYIESPMVGTFFRAPNPEAGPYVEIDDFVEADTIVGIIEAMKVMNEIKAGVSGIIKEVLVENGSPIEFGQKLFVIKPS